MSAKRSKTQQTSFFEWVENNQDFFVDKLREIVALDGVSAEPERRPKLLEVVNWVQKHIEELGGVVTRRSVGEQTLDDGKKIPLPDVLFANFGHDPNKRTLLAYGHMDVQPAYKSDGWDTEPFELTEIAGKLFGRGATDDKGPLISWLWVVKAYKELNMELPVNLKLCLEGMEEMGSIGLEEVVHKEAGPGGLIDNVDYVCISDNYWISKSKPCVTYGLRGNMYFFLEVEGSTKDLHSGKPFEPLEMQRSILASSVFVSSAPRMRGACYDLCVAC
jgi:nonspecific dipeptidase